MKYRRLILLLIGCVLIYVLLEMYPRNEETVFRQQKQYIHNNWKSKVEAKNTSRYDLKNHSHYDALLSSYMRGGSTLAGKVLGYHSDSFYVHEPLWKIARWVYWDGNDTLCRSDRTECRKISAHESPDAKFMYNMNASMSGSLHLAQEILFKIYDCKFNDFERLVFDRYIADISGPSWMSVKSCIKRKGLNASCVSQKIPAICQKAKHRVTKVLRFTLANFETLLQSRGNLKVIHLLRDPRAIVNSRIETKWYPSKDVLSSTKALCEKMITDYQEGLNLFMKYPNRFRFLYYEDINHDPKNKIRALYKYLGMSVDKSKYAHVITFKTFKSRTNKALTERERNTAFWWRKKLKWDLVKQIDNLCKDVYDALGFRTFSNYDEMQNLTFKSVNIPQEYALL